MSATSTNPSDALARILAGRHSCRGFQPDPVPREQIEAVLDLARQAPSWCNTQPWGVIVTSGTETEEVRQGLMSWSAANPPAPDIDFPDRYEGVAHARRRECAWQLYECVGVEWGDREGSARQTAKNFELFGAPHLAIITTDRALGTYGAIDCGLYVAHFLLAAQSRGIATIPQAAIAACAPYIRERFALPQDRQVLCGISFGYEDHEHPANGFRTTRAPLEEMITWAGENEVAQ